MTSRQIGWSEARRSGWLSMNCFSEHETSLTNCIKRSSCCSYPRYRSSSWSARYCSPSRTRLRSTLRHPWTTPIERSKPTPGVLSTSYNKIIIRVRKYTINCLLNYQTQLDSSMQRSSHAHSSITARWIATSRARACVAIATMYKIT